MMKSKQIVIYTSLGVFLTVAVALISGPLHAETGWGGQHNFKRMSRGIGARHIFRMLRELDATQEQRSAIGEIMDDHRPAIRESMFELMDGKNALGEILTSSDYDASQIEQLAQDQAKNVEHMFLTTAKTFADISAVLTEEQRLELAEVMKQRRGGWHKKHSHRHGRDEESL